jgi:tetrapyrrole methylase family protein/MazG family protein
MARLRSPTGCPWDREQDLISLKKYLIEETYEVIEAIDEADAKKHREELGDLLLQVVFQSQLAAENKDFSIEDVVKGINEKLLRRHPHVFGDEKVSSSRSAYQKWTQSKKTENRDRSAIEGVPKQMPALSRAYRITEKAASVGFDWEAQKEVVEKIDEELAELKVNLLKSDIKEIENELGDLLFSIVNLARHLHIDPEHALHRTSEKFSRRFRFMENECVKKNIELHTLTLPEMEELWESAKRKEHSA